LPACRRQGVRIVILSKAKDLSELNTLNSELKEGDLMLWIMDDPAMHHVGCMAALNLTWFRAKGTI
jgi:hypothetical protein